VEFLSPEEKECRRKCKEKCLRHSTPQNRNGSGGTDNDEEKLSIIQQQFIEGITSRVGGKYCSPPNPPYCTDCSGLVAEEYFTATRRTITGDSHALFDACTPVLPNNVKPGDLLFHNTGVCRSGNCDSHVGVVVSSTERVDAMNPDIGIRRGPRNTPYWYTTFTRAGRLPW
jgi:cell wall-associated NlpC family hydrolase